VKTVYFNLTTKQPCYFPPSAIHRLHRFIFRLSSSTILPEQLARQQQQQRNTKCHHRQDPKRRKKAERPNIKTHLHSVTMPNRKRRRKF
jgi:hypothetical protein